MISYTKVIPKQDRERREDSLFANDTAGLYLVADGLQGKGGDITSTLIVNNVGKVLESFLIHNAESNDFNRVSGELKRNFLSAQEECIRRIHGGTTLDCLVVRNSEAYIGHVGDSAIYAILHEGTIHKITTKDRGDSASGPEHYLGDPTLKISDDSESDLEFQTYPTTNVRYFLLATDGLTDRVDPNNMQKIVQENFEEPQQMLDKLYEAATQARFKKDDDTTMLLVDLEDTPSLVKQFKELRAGMERQAADHQRQMEEYKADQERQWREYRAEVGEDKRKIGEQLDKLRTRVTELDTEVKGKNRIVQGLERQITDAIDDLAGKYGLSIGDTTTLSGVVEDAGKKYDDERTKKVAAEQRARDAEGNATRSQGIITEAQQAFTAAGYRWDLPVNVRTVIKDKVNAENKPPIEKIVEKIIEKPIHIHTDNSEKYERREAESIRKFRNTAGRNERGLEKVLSSDLPGATDEFIAFYKMLEGNLTAYAQHEQAMHGYLDGTDITKGLLLTTRVQECVNALVAERKGRQEDKEANDKAVEAINLILDDIDKENKMGLGNLIKEAPELSGKAEAVKNYLLQKLPDLKAIETIKDYLREKLPKEYNPNDSLRDNLARYVKALEDQLPKKEGQPQEGTEQIPEEAVTERMDREGQSSYRPAEASAASSTALEYETAVLPQLNVPPEKMAVLSEKYQMYNKRYGEHQRAIDSSREKLQIKRSRITGIYNALKRRRKTSP